MLLYIKAALKKKLSQGYGNQNHNEQPIPGNAWVLSHFSCVRLSVVPWAVAPPDSSVQGILQARILEWVAMPYSRGSSKPRD